LVVVVREAIVGGKRVSSGAVAALSDILAIDWGCKKLVLDGCGLDDDVSSSTFGNDFGLSCGPFMCFI
jgi:hypothetical protein